jgi:hypothetical protein
MTKEELAEKIAEINRIASLAKRAAYSEYAETVAKFKRGDIIADCYDMILVDSISYNGGVCYCGKLLTATGRPRKSGERRTIYEERAHKITFHEKKS